MKKYAKRRSSSIICIAVILVMTIFILGCSFDKKNQFITPVLSDGRGVFEWNENTISEPKSVQNLIDELDVDRLYQELPEDFSTRKVAKFVKHMTKQRVQVYSLLGSIEWGFESDGHSLIKNMKSLVRYNESVNDDERITGVMVDVEPYVSKKWKKNRQENMNTYVEGMIKAYNYAKKNKLIMIVCIPRHYDEQGLSKQLEELISKGCDEVAVMNYGCGDEVESIATEAVLARMSNKQVHCILEFQKVGKHGLTEEETYRNKGIAAAQEVFTKVEKAYPKMPVIWDYHCTEPLLQMLDE